jgi:5-methyltetrahydropteroyltriglutamate--homocysteine methyltransferase
MPVSTPLVTTVVGSFPQPDWLVDRENLGSRLPPRVRAREIWRVPEPYLEQAQDDATLVAIREMERAGVDIITDGEIRRESYSNRFATALDGIDLDQPGTALDRTGHPNPVPRVVGPIRRRQPVEVRDLRFLRANTEHRVKITVAGPFTMAQQVQDDYYGDPEAMALDYAAAVNDEIRDLFAAGADVVQIDEPYLQARAEQARRYAIRVINRALEGVSGSTALHMCFGYAAIVHDRERRYAYLEELGEVNVRQISIEAAQPRLDLEPVGALVRAGKTLIVGVLDLGDPAVETEHVVAERIRHALSYIPPEQLVLAPDCGMKYLPRDVAVGKLRAMVAARDLVAGSRV